MWVLYCHINKTNCKKYVGITSQPVWRRWKKDGSGYVKKQRCGCTAFWNAIQKYGWDNFQHIIVMQTQDEYLVKECEKIAIEYFHSHISQHGYNISRGGDGFLRYVTQQQKQKAQKIRSQKRKQYRRKYVMLNLEKVKQSRKKYYNPQKSKQYSSRPQVMAKSNQRAKAYYAIEQNKQKKRKYDAQYHQRDYVKQKQKQYRKSQHGKQTIRLYNQRQDVKQKRRIKQSSEQYKRKARQRYMLKKNDPQFMQKRRQISRECKKRKRERRTPDNKEQHIH